MSDVFICKISGGRFAISNEDKVFYKKVGVPLPTLSPLERERRRIVWRNERHLYKRNCGLCKKSLIAIYPPECKFPVYCAQCFWGDRWNSLDYGRDFDFSRPFFEQFAELAKVVPRLAITQTKCINSDYALNCIENKNCYLTSGADYNENLMYSLNSQRSKFCGDTYLVYECELCYGCLDSMRCYNCVGCQECENCRDSWFLYDCKNCSDCAFSSNLRNQKYVFKGVQLNKEEYEKRLKGELDLLFQDYDWMDRTRHLVRKGAIHRYAMILNSENVSGNYIRNCRNACEVYDAENLWDCKYVYYSIDTHDTYDASCIGFKCSLCYELISITHAYNCAFCYGIFYCDNAYYCATCFNSSDLFGCISIQNHQKNIILNKKHSPEEYGELRTKIIEHMRKTEEFGEFFPGRLSPFEYNRSSAIDNMPLSRAEAIKKEFRWHDAENLLEKPSTYNLPTEIDLTPDTVVSEILQCELCKKNYRVITQELLFHQKMHLPLSKICWPCRLRKLITSRRSQQLSEMQCSICGMNIMAACEPPERAEGFAAEQQIYYCENCYNKAIYN